MTNPFDNTFDLNFDGQTDEFERYMEYCAVMKEGPFSNSEESSSEDEYDN